MSGSGVVLAGALSPLSQGGLTDITGLGGKLVEAAILITVIVLALRWFWQQRKR